MLCHTSVTAGVLKNSWYSLTCKGANFVQTMKSFFRVRIAIDLRGGRILLEGEDVADGCSVTSLFSLLK